MNELASCESRYVKIQRGIGRGDLLTCDLQGLSLLIHLSYGNISTAQIGTVLISHLPGYENANSRISLYSSLLPLCFFR